MVKKGDNLRPYKKQLNPPIGIVEKPGAKTRGLSHPRGRFCEAAVAALGCEFPEAVDRSSVTVQRGHLKSAREEKPPAIFARVRGGKERVAEYEPVKAWTGIRERQRPCTVPLYTRQVQDRRGRSAPGERQVRPSESLSRDLFATRRGVTLVWASSRGSICASEESD